MGELWMFYTIPTAVFSNFHGANKFSVAASDKHMFDLSVLDDPTCEMKKMTESGQQGIKPRDRPCYTSTLYEPNTNRESNPKDHLFSAGSPLSSPSTISRNY